MPRVSQSRSSQLSLPLPKARAAKPARTHGGARKGAGRKPLHGRAMVGHVRRERLTRRLPVHVTLRLLPHVRNLRAKHRYKIIREALGQAKDRFVLIVQFSVQGNHLHLLLDAPDATAITRCVQGLARRIGPKLNAELGVRGRLLMGRYHAHICRTPSEVRAVRNYIRGNFVKHLRERSVRRGLPAPALGPGFVDPCSSNAADMPFALPVAKAWLLSDQAALRARRSMTSTR